MPELFVPTLTASVLIGAMFVFAVRNRKQGWRKTRNLWLDVQPIVAMAGDKGEEKPEELPPLRHLGDLSRLHDALSRDTKPVPKPVPVPEPIPQRR
jgi:hypothetical protein